MIARSYDLLPVLVFACAALFRTAPETPMLFTLVLCLMSAVSVHGMIIAASIGVAAIVQSHRRKQAIPYAAAFGVVTALLAAASWPAKDGTFVSGYNFSFGHFLDVCGKAFAAGFTGETISSLLMVGLSIPLLWRGGGLLFFALASGLLCALNAVVYSQVWHYGVLLLAWIFAIWIAYGRLAGQREIARLMAVAAFAVVIGIQCYWTWCAIRYDWVEPYSGSLAAARGIRELGLTGRHTERRIDAIGFACVAIEPYFPANVFSNWNEGGAQGYWDWSRRNHVNEDIARLPALRPDYVIVGYKNEFEHGVWTAQVRKSGYWAIRHFEGNSFWHTRVFEPESFDLYQRSGAR